jgi:hypothetical protein
MMISCFVHHALVSVLNIGEDEIGMGKTLALLAVSAVLLTPMQMRGRGKSNGRTQGLYEFMADGQSRNRHIQ